MALPAWAAPLLPILERLALWRGYEQELQTLAIYGIGVAVYTALVFAFYMSLSRRRPVRFAASERKDWVGRASRAAERSLIFPLTSFAYFTVLAVALFVLAKNQSVEQILLISMAVIVAVRVTVYLSEAMSNDLAKLVPLSLLAVVLVDPGYLTLQAAWARFIEATQLWPLLGRYFLLFIALEAVMGVGRWTVLQVHGHAKRLTGSAAAPSPAATKATTTTLQVAEPARSPMMSAAPLAPSEPSTKAR